MGRKKGKQAEQNSLRTDRGNTTVEPPVVRNIVGVAANEIEGAGTTTGGTRLPGDTSPTITEFLGRLGGGESRTRGVSIEVDDLEASVGLTLNVLYGTPIAQATEAVRQNVIKRVENLTGLSVKEVGIEVTDVVFPEDEEGEE